MQHLRWVYMRKYSRPLLQSVVQTGASPQGSGPCQPCSCMSTGQQTFIYAGQAAWAYLLVFKTTLLHTHLHTFSLGSWPQWTPVFYCWPIKSSTGVFLKSVFLSGGANRKVTDWKTPKKNRELVFLRWWVCLTTCNACWKKQLHGQKIHPPNKII